MLSSLTTLYEPSVLEKLYFLCVGGTNAEDTLDPTRKISEREVVDVRRVQVQPFPLHAAGKERKLESFKTR